VVAGFGSALRPPTSLTPGPPNPALQPTRGGSRVLAGERFCGRRGRLKEEKGVREEKEEEKGVRFIY
jgi:hypothetical protein